MSYSHTLKTVADIVGIHSTIRLVRLKGGTTFTPPKETSLHNYHWLVTTMGMDKAKKFCKYFEGASLTIPNEVQALIQLRDKQIIDDFKNGASKSEIARGLDVSRKLVQIVIKKHLGA